MCATEAAYRLGLDQVALVPVHVPPHKHAFQDPGPDDRLLLCREAVANNGALTVLDIELVREGPSYTVDTLRELHAERPGIELTFIVGGDMALTLPSWREPDEILRLARLGVAERAEMRRAEIEAALEPLGPGGRIDFFDMPRIDISSTEIRRRVVAGLPYRHLVPPAVADEIEILRVYR